MTLNENEIDSNPKQNQNKENKRANGEEKSTFTHDLHAKIKYSLIFFIMLLQSIQNKCIYLSIHLLNWFYSFAWWFLIFSKEKKCSLNLKFCTHLHTFKIFAIFLIIHCILISGMGNFRLVICSTLECINKYKIGIHLKHGALFINKIQTFHFCHHRSLFIPWWFNIGCLSICWAPNTERTEQ